MKSLQILIGIERNQEKKQKESCSIWDGLKIKKVKLKLFFKTVNEKKILKGKKISIDQMN